MNNSIKSLVISLIFIILTSNFTYAQQLETTNEENENYEEKYKEFWYLKSNLFLDNEQILFKNEKGEILYPVSRAGYLYLPINGLSQVIGKNVEYNKTTKVLNIYGKKEKNIIKVENNNQNEENENYEALKKKFIEDVQNLKIIVDNKDIITNTYKEFDTLHRKPFIYKGELYVSFNDLYGEVFSNYYKEDYEIDTIYIKTKTPETYKNFQIEKELRFLKEISFIYLLGGIKEECYSAFVEDLISSLLHLKYITEELDDNSIDYFLDYVLNKVKQSYDMEDREDFHYTIHYIYNSINTIIVNFIDNDEESFTKIGYLLFKNYTILERTYEDLYNEGINSYDELLKYKELLKEQRECLNNIENIVLNLFDKIFTEIEEVVGESIESKNQVKEEAIIYKEELKTDIEKLYYELNEVEAKLNDLIKVVNSKETFLESDLEEVYKIQQDLNDSYKNINDILSRNFYSLIYLLIEQ